MVIKTFKFSNKNTKYKYYNDEDEIILSPSAVREVLVNKYLSLVKEEISKQSEVSYDDSNIEIKITTDNDSIQYDIIFSGIDNLPVVSPNKFANSANSQTSTNSQNLKFLNSQIPNFANFLILKFLNSQSFVK